MLRIGLVSPKGMGPHYGGPGSYAQRIYEQPVFAEDRVTVLHGHTVDAEPSRFRDVRTGSHSGRRWGQLFWGLRTAVAIVRRRRELDVVHGLGGYTNVVIPLLFARWAGLPTLLFVTSIGGDIPVGDAARPALRARLLNVCADAIVAMTPTIRRHLQAAGVRSDRIVEIPMGVDRQAYQPAGEVERAVLREQLGLHPDHLLIVTAGVVCGRKGQLDLIQALNQLRRQCPDLPFQLALVGPATDPATEQAVRDAIATAAYDIAWPGHVTNVSEWLRAADVFALLSRREGFPSAVAEAMTCGMPLVLSDIPAFDLIRGQVDGALIVKRRDERDVCRAMYTLLTSSERRDRLGAASRKASRVFGLGQVATEYRDTLSRLVAGRAR